MTPPVWCCGPTCLYDAQELQDLNLDALEVLRVLAAGCPPEAVDFVEERCSELLKFLMHDLPNMEPAEFDALLALRRSALAVLGLR